MIIAGYIEQISERQAQGWAYCAAEPARRLSVRAALDERVIGSSIANTPRPDLAAHAMGDGNHGFTIMFDMPVNAVSLRDITCVAVAPDGSQHALPHLHPDHTTPALAPPAPVVISLTPIIPSPLPDDRATRAAELLDSLLDASPSNPSSAAPGQAAQAKPPPASHPPISSALPSPAILQKAPAEWNVPKLFILGAARSGTSAMFATLTEAIGIQGFGESHVIPAFQRIIHQLRLYADLFATQDEDIMIRRMDHRHLEQTLKQYARDFYWTTFAGQGFVDKTPTGEAVWGAPLIEEIFPDAQLILMHRSGIEVVKSFRLKFTSDFTEACQAWTEAMSGILSARQQCHHVMEIDQFDMANRPFATGHALANWLGCPDIAEKIARTLASTRVEKSSSHNWSQRLTLSGVDWTIEEKNIFIHICGDMMEAFGYPI